MTEVFAKPNFPTAQSGTESLHAQAVAAFKLRNWTRAGELAQEVTRQLPAHDSAWFIAGLAALELQHWQLALICLRKATDLIPSNAAYATQFARALSTANMPNSALRAANRALNLVPDNALTFHTLAMVYTRCNVHERAVCALREAVKRAPKNAAIHFDYAMAQVYTGDIDGAQATLETCLALNPQDWRAYAKRSKLRRQTPAKNHVQQLLSLLSQTQSNATASTYLHMALSKEYEDLQEYALAFEHLSQGKAIARRERTEAIRDYQDIFTALMDAFPMRHSDLAGCPTAEPIFVVGMPRTGTTLVERILSSHPQVHSMGELSNFGIVLKQLAGYGSRPGLQVETIVASKAISWRMLGEKYLTSTRPVTDNKPHFIDKKPHNFLYIGHIAHALPNARIICLRRDPMDTCLSNFRELFSPGAEFHDYALDLLDTAKYYVAFDRLMTHWKRTFPGRIFEVQYETLVTDVEATTRAIVAHCGLPWSETCLRFEHNSASVATASSVQVREPIYRAAAGRWKKYAMQMSEVRAFLAEAGVEI
ncbi:sulfotransferase family protein [Dyella dinghuensis]|uniref:Sulfotransferase family protein n=1 Tax=Dyella dinghuensis TaxID=1920169 RepID=A0A3S0QY82_9GAMM|nr:tetratricopeptide repeat-containing sulfotransferase family protein [Dyella dinghuensis]RUL65735.1 sulfotransferase family protein [Dyella dinghuensis]